MSRVTISFISDYAKANKISDEVKRETIDQSRVIEDLRSGKLMPESEIIAMLNKTNAIQVQNYAHSLKFA